MAAARKNRTAITYGVLAPAGKEVADVPVKGRGVLGHLLDYR